MTIKVHYKSVFISDIHLGSIESKTEYLLTFFKNSTFDNLFLIGDTIDFVHLYEVHGWSKDCNKLIKKLLKRLNKGSKIKILIGNHDGFLGILNKFIFGDIEIYYETIYESNGKKYIILHGDRFDNSLKYFKTAWFLTLFYSWGQKFSIFRKIRKVFDSFIEKKVNYRKIQEYIKKKNVDGMIFGHTHLPFIKEPIMNCGDLVTNHTLIVENENGTFQLINLKDYHELEHSRNNIQQQMLEIEKSTVASC